MGKYLDIARSDATNISYRAGELREKARMASSWHGLRAVLKEAQAAFDAGEVTDDEDYALAGYAMDRSRQIPDDGVGERLSELLARQPVVRVRSRLLGEVVVWVADAAEVPEDTGEVVYTEFELRLVDGRPPAEVGAIHAVKRSLDGEVVELTPDPDEQVIPSEALYTRTTAKWGA